jgi:hypothetical protein
MDFRGTNLQAGLGIAATVAISEGDGPETWHLDWTAIRVVYQGAQPPARRRIEDVDASIAKISNEQVSPIRSDSRAIVGEINFTGI